MEDPIIGIDLGTSHSAVGVVDSGFPILLANEDSERILPSAVWFGPDGEVAVGRAARRQLAGGRVVTSAKRLIGRRLGEDLESAHPLVAGPDGSLRIELPGGTQVSPMEVGAEILKELKRIAEMRLETEVNRAVITVPAYFNDAQRSATKQAGELAGLEVMRLVAEPTAAALAYGMERLGDRSRVAVFDLGGGTFDVSLLELREGVFEVLATGGDTQLGGDDFDRELLRLVRSEGGLERDSDPALQSRLLEEAERVKRVLSEEETAVFRVPFYHEAGSVEVEVSRSRFEALIEPYLAKMAKQCRQVMADASLRPEDLDGAVLVGGSTRIPAVQRLAGEVFQREPDLSQHPDEAVALGAAIQAGVMAGTYRKLLLLDVTPLSLGIETIGGLMNVLIPRNTTIPSKAGEMFTNARDGQSGMRVRVLQGERELAKDNWELGCFDVAFEPAPRGQARVGVQFSLDENGILQVLARNVATGRDTVVDIESAAVDVSDEAVEAMVSESVEHAFEDMNARVFTEARLKAEELLPAVAAALEEFGPKLEGRERAEIVSTRDRVRERLAGDSAAELKAAVEALDRATEGLAARLVEEALAAQLATRLEGQSGQ